MVAYPIDPTNSARPLDSDPASQGAAELRALKAYLQSVLPVGVGSLNFFRRNLIINGTIDFDQRNEATAVNLATGSAGVATYVVDKFSANKIAGATATGQKVVQAIGGKSSNQINLVTTVGAAPVAGDYAVLETGIEGFDAAQLQWGTANARAVSLSFVVSSPVAGNHCFAIKNKSTLGGGATRSYVGTFNVPAANVPLAINVNNIPGDTAGAWTTNSSLGVDLVFDQGSGSTYEAAAAGVWGAVDCSRISTGAKPQTVAGTFSISDIQLEVAAAASVLEILPMQMRLAMCQRYYEKSFAIGVKPANNSTTGSMIGFTAVTAAGTWRTKWSFKVAKRGNPTMTYFGPASAAAEYWDITAGTGAGGAVATLILGANEVAISGPAAAGAAAGDFAGIHATAAADFF